MQFINLLVIVFVNGALFAQISASQNLATCLTGKYPALCNHDLLSPEQLRQVTVAEKRENLSVCMTGRYPALCRHDLLSAAELQQVQGVERAANLKLCLDGRYPVLCKHELLTSEQAKLVAATEARMAANRRTTSANAPSQYRPRASGCESGHWIDSVSDDGSIIKLEDGSMWEVDSVDTVTTSIWLPISNIVLCGSKMINTDDKESALVKPVRNSPPSASTSSPTYVVDASSDDETFVINGEVFNAKTYCFDFDKGDRVMFLEGSPFGACASAKLLNLRTQKVCEVWCE